MVLSGALSAAPIDTVLEIDTPEHLAFEVRVAGPARRSMAWLIDLVVRGVLLAAAFALGQAMFASLDLSGVAQGLALIAIFAMNWGYYFAAEMLTGGRSPGKIICGLRVVRTNGLPLTWRESVLRNLARAVDIVMVPPSHVVPLAPFVMALDKRFRRMGDMLAGTIVVYERVETLDRGEATRADPTIVGGLPRALPLSHDDLAALDVFVHRAHMSDSRRQELAAIVAPMYSGRLGRPPPADAASFLASLWARAQDPRRRIKR